jgi:hypothetical protein
MNLPVHRGIAVGLSPEDHAFVHDPRRPAAHRATRLLDAVTREGHEPLGQHWTTDRSWADHFAQQYGGHKDGQTHVVFHATHPEHDEIEHDPGWREEHEVNDSEDEVPIKRGADVEVTGVSWREHTKPGAGPAHSWNHHQFPEDDEQFHTALLRKVSKLVAEYQTPEGRIWAQTAILRRVGSVRMVPPEEYRKFHFPDYPQAKTPAALARHFKKTSPEYYDKIKSDARENGIKTPILVKWTDQRGKPLSKPQAMSGHHRAAVAHELGIHLPVGDYDNPEDHELAQQTERSWFQENERPLHDRPGYTAAVLHAVRDDDFLSQVTFQHQVSGGKRDPYHEIRATHPEAPEADGERYVRTGQRTPTKRLFGPTYGLDRRLFEGEHLKGDVRRYILETLADFWKGPYGVDWDEWARVYLAGSEASEWTSPNLEGNNDFDVLIGVDYEKFRGHMSRTDPSQLMTNAEITDRFNEQFKKLNAQTAHVTFPVDGVMVGPFENTWYCNADSYDIRRIKPYAAYNVSEDEWAVKPPHLPSWDISKFPEGPALVAECRAVAAYVRAILNLPEPYRTQQGYALWHHLHSDRSRAFSENGEGWYDPGNVIEKWLDQSGLWEKLVQIMVKVRNDPAIMRAPKDWSNSPVVV